MQLNTSEACALGILGGESKLTDGVVDVRFRHLTGLGEGITKTPRHLDLYRGWGERRRIDRVADLASGMTELSPEVVSSRFPGASPSAYTRPIAPPVVAA